ncbi:Uu.00g065720.m01.CDS01 [Anthostomella pinea]|uniref:Uu.00g065720.m01.CDS01 n=1 Tax=Anthostomella pinea TaxID=933095 RepID=A0AAI8VTT0_9PEZI|nr:Uu.00g065720.m01.CDS01 [Anthostomella pinea]
MKLLSTIATVGAALLAVTPAASIPLQSRAEWDLGAFLQNYAKIPTADQKSRIQDLYTKAQKIEPYIFPWPDIIVQSQLAGDTWGPEILAELQKDKAQFHELGAYMAPEVHWLQSKGASADKLYASNLKDGIFQLSHDFFKKGEESTSPPLDTRDHFLAPFDILDYSEGEKGASGNTVVYLNNVLHFLTDQDNPDASLAVQKKAASQCLKLLRPDAGRTVYIYIRDSALYRPEVLEGAGAQYVHSPDSMKALWNGMKDDDYWKHEIKEIKVSTRKSDIDYQASKAAWKQGGGQPFLMWTRVAVLF